MGIVLKRNSLANVPVETWRAASLQINQKNKKLKYRIKTLFSKATLVAEMYFTILALIPLLNG